MDLGPMEILYCWQSIVLSCGVHVGTRAVKGAVVLAAGDDRIKKAWVKEVIVPIIPLLLGVFSAVTLPVHPDYLVSYVDERGIDSAWLVYAAWGGAVGTFADYIHQRVRGVLNIKDAHSGSTN